MDTEAFCDVLRSEVLESAAAATAKTLEDPPGREPDSSLVRLSAWFTQLQDRDRVMVRAVAWEAARHAVFGYCCVLDGVRAIEAGPDRGRLRLTYIDSGGGETVLAQRDGRSNLHEYFGGVSNPLVP